MRKAVKARRREDGDLTQRMQRELTELLPTLAKVQETWGKLDASVNPAAVELVARLAEVCKTTEAQLAEILTHWW